MKPLHESAVPNTSNHANLLREAARTVDGLLIGMHLVVRHARLVVAHVAHGATGPLAQQLNALAGQPLDTCLGLDDPADAVQRYHLAGGGVDALTSLGKGEEHLLPDIEGLLDPYPYRAAGFLTRQGAVAAWYALLTPKAVSRKQAEALWQVLASARWDDEPRKPRPLERTGALLINAEGQVVGASPPAEDWLRRDGASDRVQDALARDDPGARLLPGAMLRVEALAGSTDHRLLTVYPTQQPPLPAGSALTPTQRAIVSYLVVGATIPEISRALERGASTVRTHVRRVYNRLDVGGRVELTERLRQL